MKWYDMIYQKINQDYYCIITQYNNKTKNDKIQYFVLTTIPFNIQANINTNKTARNSIYRYINININININIRKIVNNNNETVRVPARPACGGCGGQGAGRGGGRPPYMPRRAPAAMKT